MSETKGEQQPGESGDGRERVSHAAEREQEGVSRDLNGTAGAEWEQKGECYRGLDRETATRREQNESLERRWLSEPRWVDELCAVR